MNLKTGLITSVLFNIILIGMIFYVKSHYVGLAKGMVKKTNTAAERVIFAKNEKLLKNGQLWVAAMDLSKASTKKEAITILKKFTIAANTLVAQKNKEAIAKAKKRGSKKAVKAMKEDFFTQPSSGKWTLGWSGTSIEVTFKNKKITGLSTEALQASN